MLDCVSEGDAFKFKFQRYVHVTTMTNEIQTFHLVLLYVESSTTPFSRSFSSPWWLMALYVTFKRNKSRKKILKIEIKIKNKEFKTSPVTWWKRVFCWRYSVMPLSEWSFDSERVAFISPTMSAPCSYPIYFLKGLCKFFLRHSLYLFSYIFSDFITTSSKFNLF